MLDISMPDTLPYEFLWVFSFLSPSTISTTILQQFVQGENMIKKKKNKLTPHPLNSALLTATVLQQAANIILNTLGTLTQRNHSGEFLNGAHFDLMWEEMCVASRSKETSPFACFQKRSMEKRGKREQWQIDGKINCKLAKLSTSFAPKREDNNKTSMWTELN